MRRTLLVGFTVGGGYAALGLAYLLGNHPHEDAYILFKYAENLAAGHGFVYYPGGPPSEGATDFLWLMALASFEKAGVYAAMGAVLLNAIGAGLIGFLIADLDRGETRASRVVVPACGLVVLTQSVTVAALRGFDSLLYSALVLLLFRFAIRPPRRREWIPVICGVVALLRPVGTITEEA